MPPRKEDEIQVPENVMRASNEAFRGLTNASIPAFPSSVNFGASGFSRSMPTSGGGQAIQVAGPYGFAQTSLSPEQVGQRAQERQRAEQMGTMPRTPEQQQALLARASQAGQDIRSTMAQNLAQREQEQLKRYYAFRERQEQGRFREAMSEAEKQQSRGRSGASAMARAEQARFGAEIQRQSGADVGTGKRTPMFSWEVAQMPSGEKFTRGFMGSYSPVVGTGGQRSAASAQAPQPASPTFNLFSPVPSLQPMQNQSSGTFGLSAFNTFPYGNTFGY